MPKDHELSPADRPYASIAERIDQLRRKGIVSVPAGKARVALKNLAKKPGGERAAIALAGAIKADLLLIDDAAGRAEAARRSLRVTGTLGVLRAGAEQGLIDVPAMLARLRATSFYVDDALINAIFAPWLQP